MGIIQGGNKVGGLVVGGKSVAGIVKGGAVVFRKGEGNPDPPGGDLDVLRMPDGKLWTVRNLAIDWPDSSYYNNMPELGEIYGRLYTWQAAVDAADSIDGYHLPSNDEWVALIAACGGNAVAGGKLKSTSGWYDWDGNNGGNGTDDYGFSALPGGYYEGSYVNRLETGQWWTTLEVDSKNSIYRQLSAYLKNVAAYEGSNNNRCSVRLIKDE